MTLEEAYQKKEQNKHFIGQKGKIGFDVSNIAITPNDHYAEFMSAYDPDDNESDNQGLLAMFPSKEYDVTVFLRIPGNDVDRMHLLLDSFLEKENKA